MKPPLSISIIGITTYGRNDKGQFYLTGAYVDAVRTAGGLPILLPPGEKNIDTILELVDGVIFAGGGDVGPNRYNGVNHPTIERVDSERDDFELELARRIFKARQPVLGICRGLQILNVASGGDLFPHVPEKFGEHIRHRKDDHVNTHPVEFERDCQLAGIFGEQSVSVVSRHHQAANHISADWRVAARSADGVIEALESRLRPWLLAVQWHPEAALDDPHQRKLFQALVVAAREYRNLAKVPKSS